jgi:hypothetical protein
MGRPVNQVRVHELKVAEEGTWPFRDSSLTWHPPRRHAYVPVFDPFPCYPHRRDVAEAVAANAASICPPLWDIDIYLADREETSRTFGYSDLAEEPEAPRSPGLILLDGKRVSQHPAFTRHLIAHEYGHHLAWMANSLRPGCEQIKHTAAMEREYAALRGLPETSLHYGGGGTWHASAFEIMACDARILVLGAEPEHWPHPGIERPEGMAGIRRWWDEALARIAAARETAAAA